jgi:hypothetical protein
VLIPPQSGMFLSPAVGHLNSQFVELCNMEVFGIPVPTVPANSFPFPRWHCECKVTKFSTECAGVESPVVCVGGGGRAQSVCL